MTDHLSDVVDALAGDLSGALVAVDFDGTMASIIDDPAQAFAEPATIEALARLGSRGAHVAIVTGRPVETVKKLAGVEGRRGFENLQVFGQYGAERWDVAQNTITAMPVPPGLSDVIAALPGVLGDADAAGARIEHKGHAVVVHTRELDDANAAFDRLGAPLAALAAMHGLSAEPGRFVWEIRDDRTDKGGAMRTLLADVQPVAVVYAGDDLGDLPAFKVVEEFRAGGGQAVLVCAGSPEQDALESLSDAVVDGPLGMAVWLTEFAEDIAP